MRADILILRGEGEERWAPRYFIRSFRYVQLEGLTVRPDIGNVVFEPVQGAEN